MNSVGSMHAVLAVWPVWALMFVVIVPPFALTFAAYLVLRPRVSSDGTKTNKILALSMIVLTVAGIVAYAFAMPREKLLAYLLLLVPVVLAVFVYLLVWRRSEIGKTQSHMRVRSSASDAKKSRFLASLGMTTRRKQGRREIAAPREHRQIACATDCLRLGWWLLLLWRDFG